ncbi:type I restriction enzyme R subunit [Oceanihabitans sediminis]|uniref:Type I restriction enzyme endonuclease subunit n=1 Tax=Oceanihabitans sediminis TaxID=1812012 RepID=A0A368P6H3_9FLAO|nr:HsdR family type I site-specific deoxyribonuclease [Oceanihabitans sediminis]RBP30935.1 type I restriction enzyme R subunit [Oceanihabitans sediminis]RCU56891.1 type I restriction endonuclease subunit R [Oceanihabitans sediminis]
METPSFKEDHISQIPALQLLINMGYNYLNQEEALQARGNRTSSILLEDILRTQLHKINHARVSSKKTVPFTDSNIENAIIALKDIPMVDGYMTTSEKIYELLTLGISLDQSIEGDRKSFDLQYIDWENPENNIFHVTEEFSVLRSGLKEHYRPDIVLFVNGIPICIIECKRPDIKEPLTQAISQNLRNQKEDGIRPLYAMTQLVMAVTVNEGSYATTGTPEKFWAQWQEDFKKSNGAIDDEKEAHYRKHISKLKNTPLPDEVKKRLFNERFYYVRQYFDALETQEVKITPQDEYLFSLCSKDRLLDLIYNFTLFDNGAKKIARYQQFFAIKKAMKQIKKNNNGQRTGGVVWHTQGSGKSLTMVMLAQAIAMEPSILNPKIILVTDRTDLDTQITGTFRKCGLDVDNAKTGSQLVELLHTESDAVVTTIINKFETAVKKIKTPLTSNNIFVLVDEGHRTQHGTFNIEMQKTLPNACFIAFTGTPLFKKDKSTLSKFGTLIDSYTVDQAVKDKAVVPLLYEGRHAMQDVNAAPLDTFFNMVSEPLNDYEKADLKKKFSRADQLNIADQKIYAIAWDITKHYESNFQGRTPFKGQIVCQSKEAAVKYKNYLDEIGRVTSAVIISPPDEREGEDSAYGKTSNLVKTFWHKMMDEHGTPKKYQKNIVNRFKNDNEPELIIVVDKLLTGFDAPNNIVLYLTRKLIGHTLLQAIARVNRVSPDKDYGYIIDYYGVLEELDSALKTYSTFGDFDEEQLQGTLTNINEEIEKLPQAHSDLWQIFSSISNKKDAEAYQQLLRDEALRNKFYDQLAKYARLLKLALSSINFHKETEEKRISKYKEDLSFFMKLRAAVASRYSDKIDFKKYEGQIQKLIDTHIPTTDIVTLTELVNIFDKEAFEEEIEKVTGKAAKADMIASRTAKHITEKMDEDPAFYKRFSQLIKETIDDYLQGRIDETMYLQKIKEARDAVLSRTDSSIPASLEEKEVARAFFGIAVEEFDSHAENKETIRKISEELALKADEIILSLRRVDWYTKSGTDIQKKMVFLIGDFIIDHIRDKHNMKLSFQEIDKIAERIVEVAKIRYK